MENNKIKSWSGWFESDDGFVPFTVKATSLKHARRKLAQLYPEDAGSDGEMECDSDPKGTAFYPWPMNESRKRKINEGVWAFPDKRVPYKELKRVMKNPIPCNQAADILYHIIGDDQLFDSFAEDGPNDTTDCRIAVLDRILEIAQTHDIDWQDETYGDGKTFKDLVLTYVEHKRNELQNEAMDGWNQRKRNTGNPIMTMERKNMRNKKLNENTSISDTARKMMALAKKQKNDEMANTLSRVAEALSEYKSSFGPKNMDELSDRAGVSPEVIKKAIQYTKKNAGLVESRIKNKELAAVKESRRIQRLKNQMAEKANAKYRTTTKQLIAELGKRTKINPNKIVESLKKSRTNKVNEDRGQSVARAVLSRAFKERDIVSVENISEILSMPYDSVYRVLTSSRVVEWCDDSMDSVCWNRETMRLLIEQLYGVEW